jgi:hypothetical protein
VKAWQRFCLSPSSGLALDALRIVVGLGMAVEALLVFPYLLELYGQSGFLQADLIEALSGPALPGLLENAGIKGVTFAWLLKTFYAIHFSFALAFMLGWQTRIANVGLWFTQTLLINSGYLSSYGLDRYFHNLVFLMMWMPVNTVWSIDRWRSKQFPVASSMKTVSLRLIQGFILMTYANAGFAKAAGHDWWTGEAVWRVLNQPEFQRADFLWLANYPWLAKALSLGTIFLEAFYFAAVWVPWLGAVWSIGIVGMHLAIATALKLSLFGVTLALVNVAVFLLPRFSRSLNSNG